MPGALLTAAEPRPPGRVLGGVLPACIAAGTSAGCAGRGVSKRSARSFAALHSASVTRAAEALRAGCALPAQRLVQGRRIHVPPPVCGAVQSIPAQRHESSRATQPKLWLRGGRTRTRSSLSLCGQRDPGSISQQVPLPARTSVTARPMSAFQSALGGVRVEEAVLRDSLAGPGRAGQRYVRAHTCTRTHARAHISNARASSPASLLRRRAPSCTEVNRICSAEFRARLVHAHAHAHTCVHSFVPRN